MTPTEVAAEGNGRLQEYAETRRALAALRARIREDSDAMRQISQSVRRNKTVLNVPKRIGTFGETLEDYRSTRARCAELYELLMDLGMAAAIRDLSDFPRY
ncbi:MAG: hypothetical protein F4011_04085 [Acidimicrobiaceae bacterium]|nr:hypothetical protein [Acidimicrobiaceae bacterium]MYE79528.1 hypothetical protein [Chloroflexota bacterium]MXZ51860.1 hypothetical protein [Acidimicrobiaceae bacterium]MYB04620.1 hypothetical protein [Acidimicrobiaceae bacterium]MYG98278.1 hypothetical protein [Acidimicrobiaceae bacterium]